MNDGAECSVCLDPLSISDVTALQCGHVFHTSCICRWVSQRSSCPNCRSHIDTVPVRSILELARTPYLFGCRRMFTDRTAMMRLFPECRGSIYMAAVSAARRAHTLSGAVASQGDEFCEELAYMLAYLHFCGDPRASTAAGAHTTNEAWNIANGLASWSHRSSGSTTVLRGHLLTTSRN